MRPEPADPGLALVLDQDRLSALVGEPVRATRVRPKLGVTHVAALVAPDGGLRGWVRTLQGEAWAKADKMREAAARCGFEPGEAELPGTDVLVLWGPADSDPRLCRELGVLPEGERQVLRYNPGRRLVVRTGEVVHRVTEGRHRRRLTDLTQALDRAGVAVPTPLDPQPVRSRHVTTWPWVPGQDASADPDPEVRREVGRLLRHLHAVPTPDVPELPTRGWSDVRGAAQASLHQLLEVLPLTSAGRDGAVRDRIPQLADLARRAGDLLAAAEVAGPGELVVSHGDFSLDQCLVREGGGLLLTDFDRAVLAPRELDLASLVAADVVERWGGADLVLEGYADPLTSSLGPWVGAALLSRVVQPWRMQVEGWPEETARILKAAIEALGPAAVVVPERVGEGEDEIEVARAWPGRAPKGAAPDDIVRVAVEGRDAAGRLRAGTWTSEGAVEMLPWATDPGLPALADLAAAGEVLVHRPGRRAVVRLEGGYAKVVRRGRADGVAAAGRVGCDLARRAGLRAPAVLGVEGDVVLLETVPGRPLHDLGGAPGWDTAWARWEGAWTRLQELPHTDIDLPVHTWADEAAGLRDWAAKAGPLLMGTPWAARLRAVADGLDEAGAARLVPTHRDLHDKQLLWDGEELAVLDLDTACLAPAAIDPANLAVHADLRAAQGVWSEEDAAVVRRRALAVAEAAGVTEGEWDLARRATVARLVAVYAFRPRWRDLVAAWAEGLWG